MEVGSVSDVSNEHSTFIIVSIRPIHLDSEYGGSMFFNILANTSHLITLTKLQNKININSESASKLKVGNAYIVIDINCQYS
jgi:hypothetical protein